MFYALWFACLPGNNGSPFISVLVSANRQWLRGPLWRERCRAAFGSLNMSRTTASRLLLVEVGWECCCKGQCSPGEPRDPCLVWAQVTCLSLEWGGGGSTSQEQETGNGEHFALGKSRSFLQWNTLEMNSSRRTSCWLSIQGRRVSQRLYVLAHPVLWGPPIAPCYFL